MPKNINVNNIAGYRPVKTVEKDFPNKTSFANHVNNVGNNSNSSPESNILCTNPFIGINMERVNAPHRQRASGKQSIRIWGAIVTVCVVGIVCGGLIYATNQGSGSGVNTESFNPMGFQGDQPFVENAVSNNNFHYDIMRFGDRGMPHKIEAKQRIGLMKIKKYDENISRPRPSKNEFKELTNSINKSFNEVIGDFDATISQRKEWLDTGKSSQKEAIENKISILESERKKVESLREEMDKILSTSLFSVGRKAKALITIIDRFCDKHSRDNTQNSLNMSLLIDVLNTKEDELKKFYI